MEAKMRFTVILLALAIVSSAVGAQTVSKTYWLLEKDADGSWCGYTKQSEFKIDVAKLQPSETVRVTYSSGRLAEVTVQIEAESGDWVTVDQYTPSGNEILLRRANLLVQPSLEVIQATTIRGGKRQPFHIVQVQTLDGKKAQAPSNLGDYLPTPSVPVITDLSRTPFMRIVLEMRRRSVDKLCKGLR
jgi:hypothetical protein